MGQGRKREYPEKTPDDDLQNQNKLNPVKEGRKEKKETPGSIQTH